MDWLLDPLASPGRAQYEPPRSTTLRRFCAEKGTVEWHLFNEYLTDSQTFLFLEQLSYLSCHN